MINLLHIIGIMAVLTIYLLIKVWILTDDFKNLKEKTLYFLKSDLEREILEVKIGLEKKFSSKKRKL